MERLAWAATRSLLSRRFTSATVLAALVSAGLAFVVLTSAVSRSQADLAGDVQQTWQTPFDILVRPAGSRSSLEKSYGLIRSNYLASLAGGGISLGELERIRQVPGVSVAAPIAVVGVENWQLEGFGITTAFPPEDSIQVYRVRFSETAESGLSRYAMETHYLVVSGSGEVRVDPTTLAQRLSTKRGSISCAFPVSCFAPTHCFGSSCEKRTGAGYGLELLQPITVAGIDPVAEAELFGLQACVASGRYFVSSDQPQRAWSDPRGTAIPALISDRSFVDEQLHAGVDVDGDGSAALWSGTDPAELSGWQAVSEASASIADLYHRYLPRVGSEVDDWPIWTSSDVSFVTTGPTSLRPLTVKPNPDVYERNTFMLAGYPTDWLVPPAAKDTWFRSVTPHLPKTEAANRYWKPVGQYDPTCLPGFATLAGGNGLDGYSAPGITTHDGLSLRPTRSLGGYVNSPPLVLVNLDSARWFSGPSQFTRMPGDRFVSAIRIKTDVGGRPTGVAQEQLASIAETIRVATGLDVDIVKGASARPISIELPAGTGGRPELAATEMWSVKGAAVRVTRLVDVDVLFLILLSATAASLVVGEMSYVGFRRRRREFLTLRALGWRVDRVMGMVAIEILLLSLIASAATLLGIVILDRIFDLPIDGATFVFLPLALTGIAVVAGMAPVTAASYRTVWEGLGGAGVPVSRRPLRRIWSVAWRDLLVTGRIETFVAAISVAVGSATLGLVLLSIGSFSGGLGHTLLDFSTRQRFSDLQSILALVVACFAFLGAAEVTTTTFVNRQPQYAALRAMGWPKETMVAVLVVQSTTVAVFGAVICEAVVLAAGWLGHETAGLSAAMLAAGAVALASIVPLSLVPIWLTYRRSIARLLEGA